MQVSGLQNGLCDTTTCHQKNILKLPSLHPAYMVSLLYCIIFLEEINSCLKEVGLAVISVFGPGMIIRVGVQRKTKQQDRKKQMVFNKHWTDSV